LLSKDHADTCGFGMASESVCVVTEFSRAI